MTPGMAPGNREGFRAELLDRRQRLEKAQTTHPESPDLERLLREVDAALDRIARGTFGLCETCHDPIEADRLAADPLTRMCIDHLTPGERRALEEDLELALQIQSALLPQNRLRTAGWEVYYHYEPAGPVSGDYCDLVPANGAGLFFFAGDVAGKGVAASLLMSHLHAIFRSLVQFGMPVTELVNRANRVFCESTSSSKYATLLCGRCSNSGDVEIANAGHCPPVCVRAHGTEVIEATGLPLGMFATAEYSARRVPLGPGDSLVLYTDGLTEARNTQDDEFGAERLQQLLSGCHGLSASELADVCLADLRKFRGAARLNDDLTVVAIRRAVAE